MQDTLLGAEKEFKMENRDEQSRAELRELDDVDKPDFSDDDEESQTKRPRLADDDKIQKCRERNRVHARNTRERKRAQMDLLQQRIQDLSDEKKQLEEYEPEVSVASILMSLSSCSNLDASSNDMKSTRGIDAPSSTSQSRSYAAETIERIRLQIAATLSDDEELELSSEFQLKDKSQCSTQELETIRRERNRMHAKKTRLRKKKMLSEMEAIISTLENEIRDLKRKHNLLPTAKEEGSWPADKAVTIVARTAARPNKFTGFRHMQNKVYNGVTTITGLRGGGGGESTGASLSSPAHSAGGPSPRTVAAPPTTLPAAVVDAVARTAPVSAAPVVGAASMKPVSPQAFRAVPPPAVPAATMPLSSLAMPLSAPALAAPMPLHMVMSMFPFPMAPNYANTTGLPVNVGGDVSGVSGVGLQSQVNGTEKMPNSSKSASRSSSGGTGSTTNSSSSSASPTHSGRSGTPTISSHTTSTAGF